MPKTATKRPMTLAEYKAKNEKANKDTRSPLAKAVGWDANKTQFIRDLLTGGNDVAGRGMIAGMLGAPGDIAGLAENSLRGLIGKPQVQPWGGSEHIGQTLEQAGLVSDVRRPKTELLASLISPASAAKTVLNAPKTAMTALRALDNLDSAPTMARMGQRGAVDVGGIGKMVAPQDEALRVAQANAAKPVSEGGLGLRPDNTPEERAAAMGFEGGWAHGSPRNDITSLMPSKIGAEGPGAYATNHLPEASTYAINGDNTVYPLMVRRGAALDVGDSDGTYDALKANTDEELISNLFGQGKSAIVASHGETPEWLLKHGVPEMPVRQHYSSTPPAERLALTTP